MLVGERFMSMHMAMRVGNELSDSMRMMMMLIVRMQMLVLDHFMDVRVGMPLAQQEHDT